MTEEKKENNLESWVAAVLVKRAGSIVVDKKFFIKTQKKLEQIYATIENILREKDEE